MRMDYADDEILTLTIVLAILALVASFSWKWLSLGGVLLLPYLGIWVWSKKMASNFWEWLDAVGPVGLIVGIIASLAWGPSSAVAALVLLVGLGINLYFAHNYRKFHWYKNGKTGFVGMTSIIWWMGTWLGIANWHVSRVYWAGLSLESWVAVWVIVGSIITLYVRGGRRVTQDWRNFLKIWQAKKAK